MWNKKMLIYANANYVWSATGISQNHFFCVLMIFVMFLQMINIYFLLIIQLYYVQIIILKNI